MSRWFRFYDDAVNDPKVQRLPGEKFKAWVNLLCLASKNGGVLPSLSDISYVLRLSEDKISSLLNEFCEKGLLDPVEVDDAPMSYEPHNWSGRQFKSDRDPTATDRKRRERDRKRDTENVTRDVTDESHPPEQIQITDTEKKEICPVGKPTRTKPAVPYSDEFEIKFWQPYPRTPNMSKLEAWQVWLKLQPEDREAACQAIDPYKRFLRTKPDLETVHACRFLSKRRFDGFSSTAGSLISPDIRSSLV